MVAMPAEAADRASVDETACVGDNGNGRGRPSHQPGFPSERALVRAKRRTAC